MRHGSGLHITSLEVLGNVVVVVNVKVILLLLSRGSGGLVVSVGGISAQSSEFESCKELAMYSSLEKPPSSQRSPICCHNTILDWDCNDHLTPTGATGSRHMKKEKNCQWFCS